MIKRTILGLLFIGLAGGLGYWLAPSPDSSVRTDSPRETLTARSVAHSDKITLRRKVSTPEDTYEFIRQELNRQITVPQIDELSLTGVTIEEIVAKARVPVFVYEDAEEPVVIYAYNYALLDKHPAQLHLDRELLRQLEHENSFSTEDYGDHHVVLWRHRDEIFAAVTKGNPDSLIQRIRPLG